MQVAHENRFNSFIKSLFSSQSIFGIFSQFEFKNSKSTCTSNKAFKISYMSFSLSQVAFIAFSLPSCMSFQQIWISNIGIYWHKPQILHNHHPFIGWQVAPYHSMKVSPTLLKFGLSSILKSYKWRAPLLISSSTKHCKVTMLKYLAILIHHLNS